MKPLCLVFDLDDTLYLEREYVRSGFAAVGAWVWKRLGADGFSECAWRYFECGRRGDIFDRVAADLSLELDPSLVRKLVAVYRDHQPCLELPRDSERCLNEVAPWSRLAMITDGPAICQRNKLRALGVESFFDPLVVTDEWGESFRKPHRRAFEQIEKRWRWEAGSFFYIGDNPAKDFDTPRAMGWKTIRVRRRGGLHAGIESEPEVTPEIEIPDLTSLPRVVEQLAGGDRGTVRFAVAGVGADA